MSPAPPFEAVVFDLDGTLVDTAPDLHAHLNAMLAELGRPGLDLDEIRPLIGDGARALLRRGLEVSGGVPATVDLDRQFALFLERYTAEPARLGRPFAGAVMALERLVAAGCRLGLCTNKPQAPTDRLLEAYDLRRYFKASIGGDALAVRKPDRGHVEAVLAQLGVAAAESVMIGDSANDVLAAHAAGMPCILVSFGYTPEPAGALGAERVIDHLDELLPALAGLGRSLTDVPAPP
jgi:phosphoglycolate phosphatase